MRKLLFVAAMGVLIWAALVVPVPIASLTPVPAQSVSGLIEVTGDAATPVPDDLLFTAVELRQTTTAEAVWIGFDDRRSLTFVPAIVPPDMDPEEFIELQERQFRESVRAAAAVGLRTAGLDVGVSGDGVRVVRTFSGTPAADVLQQEDVITAVDGTPVNLASELPALLADHQPGDEVELTVRRGDETFERSVALTELTGAGEVGLGVLVTTVGLEIDLPVEVAPAPDVRVAGPSAGLMIALALYDAATETELTAGGEVAGTGTIALDGSVGAVSGVAEKVLGAADGGAEVFLVPAGVADEARSNAPDSLEVIPVRTLEEAIEALSEPR